MNKDTPMKQRPTRIDARIAERYADERDQARAEANRLREALREIERLSYESGSSAGAIAREALGDTPDE